MQDRLHVKKDGQIIYDICFNNSFDALSDELSALSYDSSVKIMIVTDTNVAPLYLEELKNSLINSFPNLFCYTFEAGEENKNLSSINEIYESLIINKFERRDILIALGGGVTGDMTGFAAATYLRGVDFIQIPTTLISMSDSSIGGKTGVDFKSYKNMVGAFHMPRLVYMNFSLLKSLPKRELCGGMGEVIKHGYIKDKALLKRLYECKESILKCDEDVLGEIIFANCNIKRAVVENDPTEKGERALLNEKLMNFSLLHGECVALGMCVAAYISYKRGNITKEDYKQLKEILTEYNLPTEITPDGFNAINVIQTMKSDKKMDKGSLKFILLQEVGNAIVDKTVTDNEIEEALLTVLK